MSAHLLIVTPRYHSNLHHAARALAADGMKLTLMVADETGRPPAEGDPEIIRLGRSPSMKAVRAALDRADPSLVAIRKTGALSIRAHRAALLSGRPCIGYDQRPYLRPRSWLESVAGVTRGRPMRRFTPVHGLPGDGARPDPRATYVPFPVEAASAPRPMDDPKPARILCVGKLAERRKNQLALLDALAPLAESFDFRLTLVGASSAGIRGAEAEQIARFESAAREGPLAGRVEIRRDAPFDEMPALYDAHDLCVLPSRREPLGTAPLEAMARGSAALISDECGSAWYVEGARRAGYECGAVFAAGSVGALRAALVARLANPQRLAFEGEAARLWTLREFSPALFAERIRALHPALAR